jgi:hypothetical protein
MSAVSAAGLNNSRKWAACVKKHQPTASISEANVDMIRESCIYSPGISIPQHGVAYRCLHAYATIELLLEGVFSTQSVQGGYMEDRWGDPVS